MDSIEKKIVSTLRKVEKSFEGKAKVEQFNRANEMFEKMVKKGLVKKRGYTLLSASDEHLIKTPRFNEPNS